MIGRLVRRIRGLTKRMRGLARRVRGRARRVLGLAPPSPRAVQTTVPSTIPRGLFFGPFPGRMPRDRSGVTDHPVYRASHARLAALVEAARGWRPEIGVTDPALPHLTDFECGAFGETIHQLSLLAVVRAEGIRFDFVVGVSLGELAAAAAAGALSSEDTVALLLGTIDGLLQSGNGDLVMLPLGALGADSGISSQLVMRGLISEVHAVRADDQASLLDKFPRAHALGMGVMPHTRGVELTGLQAVLRTLATRAPAVPLYTSSAGGRVHGRADLAFWSGMASEFAHLDELLRSLRELRSPELIGIGSIGLDAELAAAGLPAGRASSLAAFLQARDATHVAPTPHLDLQALDVRRDSHGAYERCRHAELLNTGGGTMLAIGHAAVSDILRRAEDFSSAPNSAYPILHGADGPDHARRRRALTPYFTPARQREREPAMRRHTAACVASLRERDSFALVADFARLVPFRVTAEWLGLQESGAARLLTLAPTSLRWADVEPLLNGSGLLRELHAGGELDADEVAQLSPFLLTAGLTTVTDFVVNALCALHERPAVLADVRADPAQLGPVVEELLRLEPPVHALPRVATHDTEVLGRPVPAGTMVFCGFAAANRDPAVHHLPNVLEPKRAGPRSLTFGLGPHFCLGAATGRLLSEMLLGALVHDLREFELPEDVHVLLGRASPAFHIRRRVEEIELRRTRTG